MSTQQETLAETTFDDAALFNEATTEETPAEPAAPTEQPAEAPVIDGQPRNPDGTFATKDAEAPEALTPETPVETPPVEQQHQNRIPLSEHLSVRERAQKAEGEARMERERREGLERQLYQLRQPQTQPKAEDEPDPLLDPQGFKAYLVKDFNEKLVNTTRNLQMEWAHRQHGEVFEQAYASAQQAMASGDAALRARMNNASNAGEELVRWHREQETVRLVGNDPAAYTQKILEDALKDPTYLAKAIAAATAAAGGQAAQVNGNARPAVQLPPSLTSAARADAHRGDLDDNDISDEALFRQAMR